MLNSAKTLQEYKLLASDGDLGTVKEFLFDDRFWTIRYLVVNPGGGLTRKQVLISPYFIKSLDNQQINIDLKKDEIENSPSPENDKPVSRKFEKDYNAYYRAPAYWGGPFVWGHSPLLSHNKDDWKRITFQEMEWSPDLHSTKDVSGYNVRASGEEIGIVGDFLINDKKWSISYLVVNTGNQLPGKKVLISPEWIEKVNWKGSVIMTQLPREIIMAAPGYDPAEPVITRDYESLLGEFYKKRGYWLEDTVSKHYHR